MAFGRMALWWNGLKLSKQSVSIQFFIQNFELDFGGGGCYIQMSTKIKLSNTYMYTVHC